MATVYLHRTEEQFWEMTPRQLVALIDQWKAIEKGRDIQRALIASGRDPDEIVAESAPERSNAALWAQI